MDARATVHFVAENFFVYKITTLSIIVYENKMNHEDRQEHVLHLLLVTVDSYIYTNSRPISPKLTRT